MSSRDYFDSARDIPLAARELAAELGVDVVPHKGQLQTGGPFILDALGLRGTVDGQEIHATVAHRFVGSMLGTALVACELPFRRPLWVDLSVTGRTVPSAEFSDELESEFAISTEDEPFRRSLLAEPVRGALLQCTRAGYRPLLDDQRFLMSAYGLGSRKELREFFRSALRVGAVLRDRQRTLARSGNHALLARGWLACARDLAGTLDEDALTLELEAPGGALRLWVEHPRYGSWLTSLSVALDPPLPGELRITTVSGMWERWFTSDIEVGNPEFDKQFVVRASSREYAERVISPETQSCLTTLAAEGSELLVTEGRVEWSAKRLVTQPDDTKRLLHSALRLLDALTRHAERRAAYR